MKNLPLLQSPPCFHIRTALSICFCVCVCACVYIFVYMCVLQDCDFPHSKPPLSLPFSHPLCISQMPLIARTRLKDIPIHFYFFYIYLLQSRIRAVVILQRNYRLIGPFRIPKFMTCDSFLLVLLFKGIFISSAIHWIVIFLV